MTSEEASIFLIFAALHLLLLIMPPSQHGEKNGQHKQQPMSETIY